MIITFFRDAAVWEILKIDEELLFQIEYCLTFKKISSGKREY